VRGRRRRRGGRARGKLAQAPFHPRTPHGDPLAHHDGHGTQHLSGVLATVLLAVLVDQTPQWWWAFCHAVWTTLES